MEAVSMNIVSFRELDSQVREAAQLKIQFLEEKIRKTEAEYKAALKKTTRLADDKKRRFQKVIDSAEADIKFLQYILSLNIGQKVSKEAGKKLGYISDVVLENNPNPEKIKITVWGHWVNSGSPEPEASFLHILTPEEIEEFWPRDVGDIVASGHQRLGIITRFDGQEYTVTWKAGFPEQAAYSVEQIKQLDKVEPMWAVGDRARLENNQLGVVGWTDGVSILVHLDEGGEPVRYNLPGDKVQRCDEVVAPAFWDNLFQKAEIVPDEAAIAQIEAGVSSTTEEIFDAEVLPTPDKNKRRSLTAVILFSGGGGVETGFVDAGIEPICAIEGNPSNPELSAAMIEAHRLNFPNCEVIGKPVQEIDWATIPHADILWASPMCSNFRNHSEEDESDISAAQAVASAIAAIKPRWFFLENARPYHRSKSWQIIKKALEAQNYSIEISVEDFADYSIPQKRERTIVRAAHPGEVMAPLPPTTSQISWYEALQHLIPALPDSELLPSQEEAKNAFQEKYEKLSFSPLLIHRRGTIRVVPANLPSNTITRMLFTDDKGSNCEKFMDIWLPSGEVKQVTMDCIKILQTFPDWYQLPPENGVSGSILGYSVPPKFVRDLAFTLQGRLLVEGGWDKPDEPFEYSPLEEAQEEAEVEELAEAPAIEVKAEVVEEVPETKAARHPLDRYNSPFWFVAGVVPYVPLSGTIGECCVGGGVLAHCLELMGLTVWTNDIDKNVQADYHLDATDPQSWASFPEADWIFTNPPYDEAATPIVKNAYAHAKRGIVMLLRVTWEEPCGDRAEWLLETPYTRKIVLPRYKFRKNKEGTRWASDSTTIAAFIWDKQSAALPNISLPPSEIELFHDTPENAPAWDAIAQVCRSIQPGNKGNNVIPLVPFVPSGEIELPTLELPFHQELDDQTRTWLHSEEREISLLLQEQQYLMERQSQNIIDLGLKLTSIKERLGRGRFKQWRDEVFVPWAQSKTVLAGKEAAKRYMRVARIFGELPPDLVPRFDKSALFALSSAPEEVRAEAVALAEEGTPCWPHSDVVVSHAKAQELIAKAKPKLKSKASQEEFEQSSESEEFTPKSDKTLVRDTALFVKSRTEDFSGAQLVAMLCAIVPHLTQDSIEALNTENLLNLADQVQGLVDLADKIENLVRQRVETDQAWAEAV